MGRPQDDDMMHGRRFDLDEADSEDIRHRIEETRSRLDRTVDEVVDRFRPRTLAHEFAAMFDIDAHDAAQMRAKLGRFGSRFVEQVTHNAVPTAMIGAGLLWLAFSNRSSNRADLVDTDYDEHEPEGLEPNTGNGDGAGRLRRALDRGKGMVGRGKDMMHRAKDRAKRTAAGLRTGAHTTADSTRRTFDRSKEAVVAATDKVRTVYRESPLALGLGAAAAGIVCGLLLPRTRREDEAMGKAAADVRQRAKEAADQAKQMAMSAGHRVAEAADEAGSAAVQAAGERIEQEVETAADELQQRTSGEQRSDNSGSDGHRNAGNGRSQSSQAPRGGSDSSRR